MYRALLTAVVYLFLMSVAFAANSSIVTYQGRLTNSAGQPVADGDYPAQVSFWGAAVGGDRRFMQNVILHTVNGLFSVELGIPDYEFEALRINDSEAFLQVQLDGEPAMTPRTRVTASMFAIKAQYVEGEYLGRVRTQLLPESRLESKLVLSDSLGREQSLVVQNPLNNYVQLNRPNSSLPAAFISAEENEAYLALLPSGSYTPSVYLSADNIGNAAAVLPAGSVSAFEMTNEPGLTSNDNGSTVVLTASMTDIVTTTISTPTLGYVLVFGKATAFLSGSAGTNYGYLQIDTTAGGNADSPYRTVFGSESIWTGSVTCFPVAVSRVFYVGPGSYTFRLEGRHSGLQAVNAVLDIRNSMIQAVFIPTSYGSVNTLVSELGAGQFEQKTPESIDGQTMYKVDLRELEVKAAKAEAEAEKAAAESERAQRELLEAKLQQSKN